MAEPVSPQPRGGAAARHRLVQAPVRPLDEDGVRVAQVGTLAFAVAVVVLWLRRGRLDAGGHGWYLDVAVAGVVLGLVGLAWCLRRRSRRD